MYSLTESRIRILAIGIGLGLVAAGIYPLYFIVNEFLEIYPGFESSVFVLEIIEMLVDKNLFITDHGTSVVIGEGAAVICALVFLFFLAWTSIGISVSLIKLGCHLLLPKVKSDIESIKNDVKALTSKNIDIVNKTIS